MPKITTNTSVVDQYVSTNNSKRSYSGTEIKTIAECVIQKRFVCYYCKKDTGFIPQKLKYEHSKRKNLSKVESEEVKDNEKFVINTLERKANDFLNADPAKKDYSVFDTKDAQCPVCGKVQPWYRNSEGKFMLGCGIVMVVIGLIALILVLSLSTQSDIVLIMLIIGLIGLLLSVISAINLFVNSQNLKARLAKGERNVYPEFKE